MKKLILCASLMLFASISYSQYRGTRQNGVLGTTEDYVTNSPGNSIANSRLIARYKDSTDFALYYSNVRFGMYDASKNDGVPTTILWTDANGNIKKSTIPAWITTESDPIWSSEKNNYYTKTLSDARYLQGFTESDPTVASYIKSISTTNISNWNSAFGWGNHALAGYLLASTASTTYQPLLGFTPYSASNPNGYISSFTEVDPNVPAYSKSLSSFNIIKASTDPLYRPISYVPGWTEITGKPIFALVATSGSYNDLSNKPTIPSAQVQSDWNSVSGLGQILNKPTINRTEAYSGTTNSSGEYTVTFATAFSSTPKVVPSIKTTDNRANVIVTASSTTGFTVRAVTYNVVSVLSIEVIAGSPVPINGATVNVIVSQ